MVGSISHLGEHCLAEAVVHSHDGIEASIIPPVYCSWPCHHNITWPLGHLVDRDGHDLLHLYRVNKKSVVPVELVAHLVLLREHLLQPIHKLTPVVWVDNKPNLRSTIQQVVDRPQIEVFQMDRENTTSGSRVSSGGRNTTDLPSPR